MGDILIQALIANFSLHLLYFIAGWFLLFGYFVHLLIVHVLTRLPVIGIMRTVALLHLRSVMIGFLAAPFFGVITQSLLSKQEGLFEGQSVFIWFIFSMTYAAAYYFCYYFSTVKCFNVRRLIVGGNIGVGILGYLVLKALNVIVLIP